jgi:hypothetical protein
MKPFLTLIENQMFPPKRSLEIPPSASVNISPKKVVCKIVWFVATEHLPTIANLGLNISSNGPQEKLKLSAQS